MEREFFGLSSKYGDAANNPKDQVRGSGMQWPFSNKVSALPQFLSFKTTQEDRSRKTILDPLASSGYMNISTKDAFESDQNPFLKNLSIVKQAGNKHGMAFYPLQCSDSHSACHQEARVFTVSNHSTQVSSVLQSNLATTGLNMVNSAIKPQPLGSKSSGTPLSVLPSGSIVGSTDLRNCSKSSGIPSQLTIFYDGSVCVYDDISPEKAQAIMLLAGKLSAPIQNMTVSTAKLQPAIFIPSKDDGFIRNKSSGIPSQPGGGSSSNNELTIIRPGGPSTTPSNHLESSIVVGSVGSSASKMVQPVFLPQARKASLARFLEKRKERVMNTSPYCMCKKSPECSTHGSDSVSFSMNSSGCCPLPAIN